MAREVLITPAEVAVFRTLLACFALSSFTSFAFDLRTDSEGDLVKWTRPLELTIDERVNELLGDRDASEALLRAIEHLDAATPGLPVSAKLGTPKPIGYVASASDNTNSVVVLADWPYQDKTLAVTLVTLNARTNELLDADIAFNAEQRRFKVIKNEAGLAGQTNTFDDVQNTFTHELGHVLGLMHNSMSEDLVMYPSAPPGETIKRELKQDDRDGLLSLYSEALVVRVPDSAPTPAAGCSASGSSSSLPMALVIGCVLLVLRRRRLAVVSAALLATAPALAAETGEPSVDSADDVAVVTIQARESFVHPERPGLILTRLQLTRVDCLKGRCASLETAVVAGGRVGELEQVVVHEPVPRVGEDVIVTRRYGWAKVLHVEPARQLALIRALKAESLTTPAAPAPQPPTAQPSAITR